MTSRLAPMAAAALLLAGCSDRHGPTPATEDAPRARRVIERPPSKYYDVPPHPIVAEGAGPYKLGEPLAGILYNLPTGPGVEVLDIPGVLPQLRAIRVEDGRMLIGGDPVLTSFVSVLAPEVAFTEHKIEVGSTRAAVLAAHGNPLADPVRVRDPRLVIATSLPGAKFVVTDEKVRAILITAPPARPENAAGGDAPRCDRGAPASALRTALGGEPERVDCLTATEAVAAVGDEVVVFAASSEKPRRLASLRVPGLLFAGAAHPASEAKPTAVKDEVVGVALRREARQATWSVVVARLDAAGRLQKLVDEPVYNLTASNAGWIGAQLEDLDLLVEVEARADVLVASGVLLHRADGGIRLAVPLAAITISRRRRPTVETGGTGVGETTVQPLGGDARARDAR